MAWITLEEARENLKMWLEAEKWVSTGQSYTIGTRSLTRVNLAEIEERIDFWRNQLAALENGSKGRGRVFRGVPRDL